MRKVYLICLLVGIIGYESNAQVAIEIRDKGEVIEVRKIDTSKACDPENVFGMLFEPAQHSQGLATLEKEINEILTLDKRQKSSTLLTFMVNCNGELSNIIHSQKELLDSTRQIIEYLEKKGGWAPGFNLDEIPRDSIKRLLVTIKKGKVSLK